MPTVSRHKTTSPPESPTKEYHLWTNHDRNIVQPMLNQLQKLGFLAGTPMLDETYSSDVGTLDELYPSGSL